MRFVSGVILICCICGGLAVPVALQHVISKDLGDTVDEMYDSYISISDNRGGDDDDAEMDLISQIQELYTPKHRVNRHSKSQKVKETEYLLVKTMRQRDKRYVSYLTLCHFKICNMGRKRTTRYFRMIRTTDNNDQ